MALRATEKSNLGSIYFISLVASDQFGVPERYKFIYDILSSEYDFDGTDVNFIDTQDLWEFFKANNPSALRSNCDVLLLSEYFIEEKLISSFSVRRSPTNE